MGKCPPNGWLVRVDRRRLFQTIHAVERSGSGCLVLNVAEGLEFEVVVERTGRTLSGHSLSGRVVGMVNSAVTFVAHAEALMGTVWTPGAAYEVVPLNGSVHVEVSFTADNRSIPLFIAACHPTREGFARIINRDDRPGTVNIHTIDDDGRRFGPATLSLAAGQTVHFNCEDLEMGNAAKGLSGGVGAGEGDWRLELAADVDIQALAYVCADDGLLTSMKALAPMSGGRHEVVIFNPASNDMQVSRLRFINPADTTITIDGVDDTGAPPPEGNITLTSPAGAATAITAQQLEAGADHFRGRFGDGKWRLFIEADQAIKAMSLLESPTGHITNLSSGTAVR